MSIEYEIDCDPETVFNQLTDAGFLTERLEALGEDPPSVKVTRKGGKVEIALQRVKRLKLPAIAAKIVGDEQRFSMRESWEPDDDGWRGQYRLDVEGAPATIEAEMALYPEGDGCIYRIQHTPRVRVPVVGRKLESILMKETLTGCDAEIDYLVESVT